MVLDIRQVVVRTWGEKLDFEEVEGRRWYVETEPRVERDVLVEVLGIVRAWLVDRKVADFTEPWWKIKQCPYCVERWRRYLERRKGKGINVWFYQRCFRHLIPDLVVIYHIIDNNPRQLEIYLNDDTVTHVRYMTCSCKYVVTVDVYDNHAIGTIAKSANPERKLTFIYKRHFNAYPLMSAFDTICNSLRIIIDDLEEAVKGNPPYTTNIYYNNELIYEVAYKHS